MRYKVVIEIDVDADTKRATVNSLAHEMAVLAVTKYSNPVFLSTEQLVSTQELQVLRATKN